MWGGGRSILHTSREVSLGKTSDEESLCSRCFLLGSQRENNNASFFPTSRHTLVVVSLFSASDGAFFFVVGTMLCECYGKYLTYTLVDSYLIFGKKMH